LTRQTFGSVNVRAHLWPERRAMRGDEEMEDAFRSAVVAGFGDTPARKCPPIAVRAIAVRNRIAPSPPQV
jgi:hypothetical protein